ncbi:sensor histidine kinase [Telluribacter sp.]|jgi:sensor histidine kinase YesM|uniref:sensor histidine kinase n=1 Tax=Telluribacter sp. TaxID=1978767 RepID=UPI002E146C24|nr:histidine kinase [Telluribacter sp.]
MKKLNDTRFRIIGMLIQNLIFFLFFYLKQVVVRGEPLWKVVAWQVLFVAVIWECVRFVIRISRHRYPGLGLIRPRIIYLALLLTLLAVVVGSWHVWMELWLGFWLEEQHDIYNYLYSIGMTLFFSQLIAGIYEATYYLDQWKKSVLRTDELEKRTLQSQLDSLKNQVSPHFLFNSLNSLTALVEEDPKRAVRFIEELSAIYRYLLQSNEQELTTLARELEFMDAYSYLLKTRFEEGFSITKEIESVHYEYLIPPLTLQILVENAIKHNMVSESKPLHIRIYSDEANNLIVVNNLQKRKTYVPSSKTGLMNISAKYSLLNQPPIVVNESNSHFQVIVPLITNQRHELNHNRR